MPAYETDQEQIEIIKKWAKEYGKWVIIAIAVGLAIGFGWRYWNQQQLAHRQQASLLFQQLLVADNKNDADSSTQMATEIINRYPQSEYASLASLIAAKVAVDKNDSTAALQKLQWVLSHSKNVSIQQIARLRTARILLSQQKYPEALNLLATVNDPTFEPMSNEIKGDIYLAMGDKVKAREFYQSAQLGMSGVGAEDKLLAMKLAQ